jgi:tetratricopeptide (TPR) repeat protein
MSRVLPLLIAVSALVVALVALLCTDGKQPATVPDDLETSPSEMGRPNLQGPENDLAGLEARLSEIERRLGEAAPGAALPEADRALLDELRALMTPATRTWLRAQTESQTHQADVRQSYADRIKQDAAQARLTVEEFRADFSSAMELKGEFDERLASVERFINAYPDTVFAYEAAVHLGVTLRWKKRNEEAERHYRRVIDAAGDAVDSGGTSLRAKALFRLAGLLIDEGRMSEAETVAGTLEKDHADVLHPLGSNTYARITRASILKANRKK